MALTRVMMSCRRCPACEQNTTIVKIRESGRVCNFSIGFIDLKYNVSMSSSQIWLQSSLDPILS